MARVMDAQAEAARLRAALEAAQREVVLAGGMRLRPRVVARPPGRVSTRPTASCGPAWRSSLPPAASPRTSSSGWWTSWASCAGARSTLCWRYGEKRIRFWHGLDEGFGGRKAIPENETEA